MWKHKKDIRGTLTKVEEYNKDRPQINVIENKQNPKLLRVNKWKSSSFKKLK